MSDAILVFNAGSSSIKFTEFVIGQSGALEASYKGRLEDLYGRARFEIRNAEGALAGDHVWPLDAAPEHAGGLDFLFSWLARHDSGTQVAAIGHRVVHGGPEHLSPVRVDAAVLDRLERLVPLAPLHQPHNLLPIRILKQMHPELPQVACFDTAFHSTAPALSQAFALPLQITDLGVRRYGFHGLSYEYIASALARHDTRAAEGKTVVLHLGNGASMCALDQGRSVATTMGFTAVDGLPMGTRSGSLDPGVLLYLMQELRMDGQAIEALLYRESGLLGVSGVSSDMRTLLESSDSRAKFAVDLFVYRIGRELGSLVAALGGLDAIVFTAGIGERAPVVREAVCHQAAWMGLRFDPAANASHGPRISANDSRVAAWVIPTNEELMIALHTLALHARLPQGGQTQAPVQTGARTDFERGVP